MVYISVIGEDECGDVYITVGRVGVIDCDWSIIGTVNDEWSCCDVWEGSRGINCTVVECERSGSTVIWSWNKVHGSTSCDGKGSTSGRLSETCNRSDGVVDVSIVCGDRDGEVYVLSSCCSGEVIVRNWSIIDTRDGDGSSGCICSRQEESSISHSISECIGSTIIRISKIDQICSIEIGSPCCHKHRTSRSRKVEVTICRKCHDRTDWYARSSIICKQVDSGSSQIFCSSQATIINSIMRSKLHECDILTVTYRCRKFPIRWHECSCRSGNESSSKYPIIITDKDECSCISSWERTTSIRDLECTDITIVFLESPFTCKTADLVAWSFCCCPRSCCSIVVCPSKNLHISKRSCLFYQDIPRICIGTGSCLVESESAISSNTPYICPIVCIFRGIPTDEITRKNIVGCYCLIKCRGILTSKIWEDFLIFCTCYHSCIDQYLIHHSWEWTSVCSYITAIPYEHRLTSCCRSECCCIGCGIPTSIICTHIYSCAWTRQGDDTKIWTCDCSIIVRSSRSCCLIIDIEWRQCRGNHRMCRGGIISKS